MKEPLCNIPLIATTVKFCEIWIFYSYIFVLDSELGDVLDPFFKVNIRFVERITIMITFFRSIWDFDQWKSLVGLISAIDVNHKQARIFILLVIFKFIRAVEHLIIIIKTQCNEFFDLVNFE